MVHFNIYNGLILFNDYINSKAFKNNNYNILMHVSYIFIKINNILKFINLIRVDYMLHLIYIYTYIYIYIYNDLIPFNYYINDRLFKKNECMYHVYLIKSVIY